MEGVIILRFLYEMQTRRFYGFLATVCILQAFFLAGLNGLHVWGIRHAVVERELAAASCLLDQGVSETMVASAWSNTETTDAGRQFLEYIGHTEQIRGYLWLLAEETAGPFPLVSLAGGAVLTVILLGGTALFLQKRERLYEEAETIVAQYAEERFEKHLPEGEKGGLYQLFGRVERLALSLQVRSEAQRKAKEFLRDMISAISHQLKTPLAALTMYMEIMEEEAGREETVRKFAEKSMQSLERMEQLIQSLLKMARLDSGNIVFEKRWCFVSEMVSEAVEELSERAERERKTIVKSGSAEEMICCDPVWTKEAVGNLVKNALDHTAAGGTIRIAWQHSPGIQVLTVKDDGCGIWPEDIHHIFKRFYRSRHSNDRQGIGLGLSLAKMIVDGQGGTLSAKSRPGEGSTFRMSFLSDSSLRNRKPEFTGM